MDNIDKTIIHVVEKQKRKKRNAIIIVIIALIALGIGGSLIPKEEKTYSPDVSYEAEIVAMGVAKQSLSNPETADYRNTNTEKSGQFYTCTGTLIGQNNFGVKQSAKYKVIVEYTAKTKPIDVLDRKHWKVIEKTVE